jgi:hypothetical protein
MAQGIVQKIVTKDWDGPQGQVTLYSFTLEGNKAWFRTGKMNPAKFGIKEGKSIKFSSDERGNVDYKSVTVLADGEIQRAPAPASRGGSTPVAASRDSYWEAKEARDVAKDERYQTVDIPRMTYCGAQELAVKVVELTIANGGITLPAKKSAILDTLISVVDEVALTLAKKRMAAPELLGAALTNDADSKAPDDADAVSYDDEE